MLGFFLLVFGAQPLTNCGDGLFFAPGPPPVAAYAKDLKLETAQSYVAALNTTVETYAPPRALGRYMLNGASMYGEHAVLSASYEGALWKFCVANTSIKAVTGEMLDDLRVMFNTALVAYGQAQQPRRRDPQLSQAAALATVRRCDNELVGSCDDWIKKQPQPHQALAFCEENPALSAVLENSGFSDGLGVLTCGADGKFVACRPTIEEVDDTTQTIDFSSDGLERFELSNTNGRMCLVKSQSDRAVGLYNSDCYTCAIQVGDKFLVLKSGEKWTLGVPGEYLSARHVMSVLPAVLSGLQHIPEVMQFIRSPDPNSQLSDAIRLRLHNVTRLVRYPNKEGSIVIKKLGYIRADA